MTILLATVWIASFVFAVTVIATAEEEDRYDEARDNFRDGDGMS